MKYKNSILHKTRAFYVALKIVNSCQSKTINCVFLTKGLGEMNYTSEPDVTVEMNDIVLELKNSVLGNIWAY